MAYYSTNCKTSFFNCKVSPSLEVTATASLNTIFHSLYDDVETDVDKFRLIVRPISCSDCKFWDAFLYGGNPRFVA